MQKSDLHTLQLVPHLQQFTCVHRGKSKKCGNKFLQPFRKDFGSLSTLRSFCAGIIKNVCSICDLRMHNRAVFT